MEYGSADGHICMCCFEYKFKIIDVDNNNIDLKNTTGLNLLAKIKHQRVLIVSNLSLCYAKLNLHEKSIEKDELV